MLDPEEGAVITTRIDVPRAGGRTLLAFLVAVGLLAAACGGDDDGSETSTDAETTAGEETTAGDETDSGAFPVTIEHKFGTTTIEEPPEKVVTVGLTDQDTVLALGVQPVGVRDWYGDQPYGTFPWAQDALGDAEPELVGDGTAIDFEVVADLEPDLIVGMYEDLSDTYDTLSQIAPTIGQSADHEQYAQPWQETTRMVGQALGRSDKAEDLISDVEDKFAEARDEHPEFQDTTAAMAQFGEGSGTYFLLPPADPKAAFLTQLGFTIPDDITDLIEDEQSTELSFERLDLVDRDIAVWLAGFESPDLVAEVQNSSIYQSLDVAKEDRDIFLEEGVDELSWATVLSIPAAIDAVVPQLAELVGGGAQDDG